MTTRLSDVGQDLFDQLTARTFYVVDSEFSEHEGQHHLLSLAIVPVIGGRRARVGEELYREMNPGVPIDDASRAIHGISDDDVVGRKPFSHYARVIVERLREPGAVFVSHSTIDAHVLRRELERLTERAAAGEQALTVGLADLPTLPIINTQLLAHAAKYPGVGKTKFIRLDKLCDLTGVKRPATAHHAREDARATANAFIELLRYIAENAVYWTFEDLLAAADGGTTHAPAGPAHIRSRGRRRPDLPAEHVVKHITPLADPVPAGSAAAERWLDMAAECAQLRCPDLRDEAKVAATANGAILIGPLMDDLPHLTQPGQAGALLGAVAELLSVGGTQTLPIRSALRWWSTSRPIIHASAACDRSSPTTMCPSCHDGAPCPRDVVHLALAEIATLGEAGVMNLARARRLTDRHDTSPLNTWRKHHRDILAYALWRVARFQLDEGLHEAASSTIDQGVALGLHTIEPRLAELACERLVETGDPATAFTVAQSVLAQRTTDPAYADLDDWLLFTQTTLYAQQPQPRKPITHPRRARPAGHANPRRYS